MKTLVCNGCREQLNVSCWEEVLSDDSMKFWHEANLWKGQLPDIPHLFYWLTGGFEGFLASLCGVQLSVGTSGLTIPPGISFVPSTSDCVLFGATAIPHNEILDPSATSPTVFFRPEGVSKNVLLQCLQLFDVKLSFPASSVTPIRMFVLYRRNACRIMNEPVSKWEVHGRLNASEAFWEQWDSLADERTTIFDKKRLNTTDLKKLDDSYIRTNLLMVDAPCTRLSTVAHCESQCNVEPPKADVRVIRSARPLPDLCRAGQCKAHKRVRPPMNRQRNHFRRSTTLRGHYMQRRVRNMRRSPFFGKSPGLPRPLARDGPHQLLVPV